MLLSCEVEASKKLIPPDTLLRQKKTTKHQLYINQAMYTDGAVEIYQMI